MVRNRAVRSLRAVLVAVLMIGGLGSAVPAGAQESLGVFPSFLEIPDALRGGSFSRTIAVQNFDADEATTISIQATGDIADWVAFTDPETGTEDLTTFELEPNEGREVSIDFTVPDDIPNGQFQGQIVVDSFLGQGGDGGVGVGLSIAVQTTVDVTGDEIRESSLQDVRVDPAEVGLDQRFVATVNNAGNVRVEPRVDVVISRDDDVVAEISSGEAFFRVEPAETAEAYVDWDTSEVAAGDYTAAFSVYDIATREPVLIDERVTEFRLEPTGALTRNAEFFEFALINNPEVGGEAIIEGSVTNTGQLEIQAVLDADVSVDGGDSTPITSLPQRIGPGGSAALELRVPIESAGSYEVTALVNYDGVESEIRTVTFTPSEAEEEAAEESGAVVGEGDASDDGGGFPWPLVGGIAAGVVVIGGGGFFFSRRQPKATGRHAG